jgi:predicted permease
VALVALAIVVFTTAGIAAERRYREGADRFARRIMDLMLWGLMPPIAFLVVARLDLGGGTGAGLLFGYVEIAVVGTLAYLAGTRLLHLDRPCTGTLVIATIIVNTGYLGIPLNAALFGRDAVAPAVAFDSLVSSLVLYTAGFGVGAAFGTRAGTTARERLRSFATRNPVLPAVILGLLVPDQLAPQALVDLAEHAAFVLLPLGFFVLGVHLTEERDDGKLRFPPPLTSLVATVVGLRLVVAPAVMLALSAAIVAVPDAYLVQAAMPTGINSLIVAHVYGLDVPLAASAIAWSTAIVVVAALVLAPVL